MTSSCLPRSVRARALVAVTGVLLAGLVAPTADAVVSPRARFSDRDVRIGAQVAVRVGRDTRPHGTRLVLQRRQLDGWRTVDAHGERTKHHWRFQVPTHQLGRFAYRVAAREGGKVRSASRPKDVRVRPSYDPAGKASDHTFLGNRPFRWNSCAEITWAFNPRHAPRHALDQVRTTIRKARQATGLRFDYVGRTDRTPTLSPQRGDAKVIVGWRTPRTFRYFRAHPGRVGVGGTSWHTGFEEADGTRVNKAWSGRLILNARYADDLQRGYGRGFTWGDVILHEFGHVLGLGHVNGRAQEMYPEMTRHKARWGAGDLAGLRRLGSARGCVERVDGRSRGHLDAASRR